MSAFLRELRGGWRNLLAATIGLGFGIPCYTPVSSLFFRSVGMQFGWSKAVAAGALIALPIAALAFPFAGRLIDRFGVRAISGFSVVTAVLSYLWLSRLSGGVGEYYAAIIALNVLGCGTGPMCYTVLVAGQFREARGAALACAQFGIAFVAVLFPPIIGLTMSSYGWRGGYLLLAATTLAGGILAQLLMRPVQFTAAQPHSGDRVTARVAASSAAFWLLGLAILAISIASIGLVSAFQSVLVERGIAEHTATWFLSLLAVSVMLSRLAVGRVLDLKHPARSSAIVMGLAAIGSGLLLTPPATPVTGLATVLVGFSIGAELDLMAYFCARLFGLRHYAAIYGLLAMFFYVGMALGGFGYGLMCDRLGSYEPALLMTTVLLALGGCLFLGLDRRAWMSPPDFLGIHHLKFPVTDLERSCDFYSRVFGARRLGHLDHYDADKRLYAIILDVPHLGTPLELRLNATQAMHHKGFDPITLKVEGRADLHKWIDHLQRERVPHSPVLTAYVGWLVAFEDPDGRRIRLYTNERHGPELTPSTDPIWL